MFAKLVLEGMGLLSWLDVTLELLATFTTTKEKPAKENSIKRKTGKHGKMEIPSKPT